MGPRAGGREEKKHNLSFVELWKYYKSEDHEKLTLRPRNVHKVDTKTTNKTTKLQKVDTKTTNKTTKLYESWRFHHQGLGGRELLT